MPIGFFLPEGKASPIPLLPNCSACGLWKKCLSPKMPHSGEGKKKILIWAESAGKNEDEQGKQFVGVSGQLLEESLAKFGIEMRRDCWLVNSLWCRTPNNQLTNDRWIDFCRPNLVKTVKELQPEIIILLGATAVKSLIGWQWKPKVGPLGRWVGWQIPCQSLNAWITPTWHPAWILREENAGNHLAKKLFERHLRKACRLKGRPWETVPDYRKQIKIVLDDDKAARYIERLCDIGGIVSFDYETDRLKPDHNDATIYCCSISNGEISVAFPWHGKSKRLMGKLLKSDIPKIGQNCKFEERWTIKEFGHGVNNWKWDTMLASHILDNREGGITSLDFQSFVMLGYPEFKSGTDSYLDDAKTSNSENRIREIDLETILLRNGLDSLLEFKIAEKQMKLLKRDLHEEGI